ncbi:hypothetical protein ABGB16_27325 [Micromonospora sp. B11E3]|uniref:hypothetical protein n=1 Tax=Micromonospora sp. B11E3 TaxID=3153562 RepID=UPI00325E5A53
MGGTTDGTQEKRTPADKRVLVETKTVATVAVRNWDHVVPAVLGRVTDDEFDLRVVGAEKLYPMGHEVYDVVETSLSRYVQARAAGRDDIVGIPHFVMRGFRHRCLLTRVESDMISIDQLKGAGIGLSGWVDSGNIWTKAAIREAGIDIPDARWYVGRLTDQDPVRNHVGHGEQKGTVNGIPEDTSLMSLLQAGKLDAIMTAFMPPGFIEGKTGLRHLLPDFVAAEIEYFRRVAFVPGIHLLTVRRPVHETYPNLAGAVSRVLVESERIWGLSRARHCDTTPWILQDLERTATALTPGWNAQGLEPNRTMLDSFLDEMVSQNIITNRPTVDDLFFGVDV